MRPITATVGPYASCFGHKRCFGPNTDDRKLLTLVTNTVDTTPRRLIVTPVSQTNAGTLLITGTTWDGHNGDNYRPIERTAARS
jgi:hypothetical protein